MPEVWRVPLPAGARSPFAVYLNGVAQQEGRDYTVHGRELHFTKELAKEGRLGLGRWTLGAIGIGTYRKNDIIDLTWTAADGSTRMAHDLSWVAPASKRG